MPDGTAAVDRQDRRFVGGHVEERLPDVEPAGRVADQGERVAGRELAARDPFGDVAAQARRAELDGGGGEVVEVVDRDAPGVLVRGVVPAVEDLRDPRVIIELAERIEPDEARNEHEVMARSAAGESPVFGHDRYAILYMRPGPESNGRHFLTRALDGAAGMVSWSGDDVLPTWRRSCPGLETTLSRSGDEALTAWRRHSPGLEMTLSTSGDDALQVWRWPPPRLGLRRSSSGERCFPARSGPAHRRERHDASPPGARPLTTQRTLSHLF